MLVNIVCFGNMHIYLDACAHQQKMWNTCIHTLVLFCFTCFSMSTENLVENLLGDFEFEVQVPYLLYRNADQEVNGIWFYNSRECEDIANLFTRYSIFTLAPTF